MKDVNISTNKGIAILLGLVIVFFVAVQIITSDESSKKITDFQPQPVPVQVQPQVQSQPKQVNDSMPKVFQDEFIAGCVGEGVGYTDCKCMLTYLEENMTNAEIYEMALEFSDTDVLTPIMYDAAIACS